MEVIKEATWGAKIEEKCVSKMEAKFYIKMKAILGVISGSK